MGKCHAPQSSIHNPQSTIHSFILQIPHPTVLCSSAPQFSAPHAPQFYGFMLLTAPHCSTVLWFYAPHCSTLLHAAPQFSVFCEFKLVFLHYLYIFVFTKWQIFQWANMRQKRSVIWRKGMVIWCNDFNSHFVLPATPKGSACTSLDPNHNK